MKTKLIIAPIRTSDGTFLAHYSARGLAGLEFPRGNRPGSTSIAPDGPLSAAIRRWHLTTTKALERALAGRAPRKLPPLDLSSGTVFQRAVWGALRKIALGKTRSYGEIAVSLGRPQAVRAVGGACGANPVAILVPCHRVLAANGQLGGFGAGLKWKRALLAREGIRVG